MNSGPRVAFAGVARGIGMTLERRRGAGWSMQQQTQKTFGAAPGRLMFLPRTADQVFESLQSSGPRFRVIVE